jgi:disulfide bond formation protein DsbB
MSIAQASEHLSESKNTWKTPAMSWVLTALLLSVATLVGSLWLSLGMGLKACPLCFYQRTFVMAVIGVLAIGLFAGSQHRHLLPFLALPLAAGGVSVALFHVYLETTGKLECPYGLWDIGTAPQQSLAAQALVMLVLLLAVWRLGVAGDVSRKMGIVCAVVLGAIFAWAAIASTPPPPPVPNKPYEQSPDTCRPPFRPAKV